VIWVRTTSSVFPASRCWSVSPTHRIGISPAFTADFSFRFTLSSVSPNSWRRSEWPTITYAHPASLSIPGATSPVNAPFSSQCRSWAPSITPEAPIPAATTSSDVKGGQITALAAPFHGPSFVNASMKAFDSPLVLNIFQFAAAMR
jgi:hypothetical protein